MVGVGWPTIITTIVDTRSEVMSLALLVFTWVFSHGGCFGWQRQEAQLIHLVGSTSRCSRDFVDVTFSVVLVIARAHLHVARRACMASHGSLPSGLR